MVGEILAALMCYGLYSKTFRKSERRAYQGVRLDKPHKFPGNVGRMTSSSRCRETTGDLWKHSRRTNTNDALTQQFYYSMNYHPSLISLSAELPNSRQPRECRRTFLCMHGTPHPAPNFLQRDIDTVLSMWPWDVVVGYPKGNSFLHPKYRIHHAGMTRGTTQ